MADTPQNDAVTQALDKIRAEFDRQRLFLERWRTDMAPIEEAHLETQRWAVAFAQSGFRTLAFIHGGALIALPALISVFGLLGSQSLIVAASCFGFGIATVVFGYLMCFKCVEYLTSSLYWKREALAILAKANDRPDLNPKEETQLKVKDAEKKRDENWDLAARYKGVGIIAMLISLIAFFIGAGMVIADGWSSLG